MTLTTNIVPSSSSSPSSWWSSSCSSSSLLSWLFEGLGGTVHGSFFQPSKAVNQNKKPGTTGLENPWGTFTQYLNLTFFFYSPNVIWFLQALCLYMMFPYSTTTTTITTTTTTTMTLLITIFQHRLLVTLTYVYLYFGFWHGVLYYWNWSSRPFLEHRTYNWSKVLHNIFYTTLGVIQWSVVEVAYIYCYQTGRLGTISIPLIDGPTSTGTNTTTTTTTTTNLDTTCFVIWCLLIPPMRKFAFYFGHRLIHTRFLYRYIHAVHHRNIDIEPFSGMCMHPGEHLYYFACYGPYLWLARAGAPGAHPFLLFWIGYHALISPGASHSGYEDHWGADLYHYLHHRYFECNYGSPGVPFDLWFGTFRDKLVLEEEDVRDDSDDKNNKTRTEVDVKATLVGWPENMTFVLFGLVAPSIYLYLCLTQPTLNIATSTATSSPVLMSYVIASAPIWVAALLHCPPWSSTTTPWTTLMFPFHKDSLWKATLHIGIGMGLCSVIPVANLIELLLKDPASVSS